MEKTQNCQRIYYHDKSIEDNPTNAHAYNNKASQLHSLGKYVKAIACYDKAIELNPHFAIALRNKGNSLKKIEKYEDAIGCFQKANIQKVEENYF